MVNEAEGQVRHYFRFDNVPIQLRYTYHKNMGRFEADVQGQHYRFTPNGLKLVRACAAQSRHDNVVEYVERRDRHGQVFASGFVRNPMGF